MRNTLLRDSDVFGMACGLEIRVPFLDQRVVTFACQIRSEHLVRRGGPNKPLLAAAVGKDIPRRIVTASKRGFSLPYARWMSGPLRPLFESHLDTLRTSGLVDGHEVTKIWSEFLAHPEGTSWSRAWTLGVLGAWLAKRPGLHMSARRAAA